MMKIVSIFGKSLFSFHYPDKNEDEFSRLFNLWNDPEYLEEFFETHKSDLKSGYWTHSNVEEAIFATIENAQDFEDALLDLSEKDEDSQLDGLETIFRPLSDSSYHIVHYNKSKARKNWLRIYALRLERDVYIVTGGAIKLTKKMQDREHTQKELFKIEKCRQYLIENNIVDVDGLIEEIEN